MRGIGLLVATLAAVLASSSAAEDNAAHAGYEAALDRAMTRYPVKAALIGIAVGEQAPSFAARGELMTGVPATTDTHFRNGAVAISYLGTLLLRLSEEGVVSLDDPVAKWFPDYPQADLVTLEMLIRGTSGYADYVTDASFLKMLLDDPFRAWTPDELVAIGLGQAMRCEKGTCWYYAHTNFVILGAVLSRAAGKPLAKILEEYISMPLGLTGTVSDQSYLCYLFVARGAVERLPRPRPRSLRSSSAEKVQVRSKSLKVAYADVARCVELASRDFAAQRLGQTYMDVML